MKQKLLIPGLSIFSGYICNDSMNPFIAEVSQSLEFWIWQSLNSLLPSGGVRTDQGPSVCDFPWLSRILGLLSSLEGLLITPGSAPVLEDLLGLWPQVFSTRSYIQGNSLHLKKEFRPCLGGL